MLRLLPLVSEVTSSQNVNSSNNVTGGGVDYDSGPYTVMIPARQTSVPFNIPINNDNILEVDEVFTLTINPPPTCTVDDPSSTTVAIVDDESKYYIHVLEN